MTEVNFDGNFVNEETAKDGDIIEIIGEGEYQEIEFKGKKKLLFNIPVKIGERDLIYTPNQKAGKILQKAWGKNTKAWIGKKFTVKIITIEIAGQEKNTIRPVI